jgi:death-on-curing protein
VTAAVEYLDLEDVLELAERLLGAPVPIRDVGLLGSAVARPQTTVGGHDAYVDLWTKAAALLQSIVNNHALIDGNKRLGWLAAAVFLELNGIAITAAANSDVYDLVIDVASGPSSIDDIAARLRHLLPATPQSP